MLTLSTRAHFFRLRQTVRTNSSFLDALFSRRCAAAPTVDGTQTSQNYGTEKTITLDENSFKLYRLESGPESNVKLTKEEALKLYTDMQMIRRMENAADHLYKEKFIRGFCHLYSGQEAIAVGMRSVMNDKDNLITAYRCHGWAYLMGVSVHKILAELCGRKSGVQRGKGGSMHMYCPYFFGGNGIVGAQVPLGTGIALACQLKKNGNVCISLYGDGAANQGQVFEAYNIACLWKLPAVFVCENNQYGMGTRVDRSSCCTAYHERAAYIPGLWTDAMNVLAVRSATQFALEYARKTGPIVIEMYTYRYSGHSMSDPGTSYRSRDEVQEVRQKRDPISKFAELCKGQGLLTEEEIKAVDEKCRKEVDEAAAKSKADAEIELKELVADVYSKNLDPQLRGINGFNLQHMQINKGANH